MSCTLRCPLEQKLSSGCRDFGNNARVTLACDNQGVVDRTRQGVGLAKNMHTRHLWPQAARDEGQLDVVKIPTERDPADLLTEPLPFDRVQGLCKLVGVEFDQDSKTLEVSSVSQFEVPQNLNEAWPMARVA